MLETRSSPRVKIESQSIKKSPTKVPQNYVGLLFVGLLTNETLLARADENNSLPSCEGNT